MKIIGFLIKNNSNRGHIWQPINLNLRGEEKKQEIAALKIIKKKKKQKLIYFINSAYKSLFEDLS